MMNSSEADHVPSCLHRGGTRSFAALRIRQEAHASLRLKLVAQRHQSKKTSGEADVRAEPPASRQNGLAVENALERFVA